MSRPLFTNNAASALAQAITPTDTILKLTPGTGSYFPQPTIGDYFMLTLVQINNPEVSEIVECIDRVGDTLTVVRGQEGTQPQIFNLSDNVELRITAGSLNLFAIGGGGGSSASGTSVADYTATQGQTAFTLPWSYTQGIDNLAIFINGSKQVVNVNYTESTTTSFTMASGLNAGDIVQAIYNLPLAGGVIDASNVIYNEGSSGAVNSTVRAKLQESVSVKDFGAVGDGTTDDTAAIQAAHNAARQVLYPVGTYKISNSIVLGSGAIIIGQGTGAGGATTSNSSIVQTTTSAYAYTMDCPVSTLWEGPRFFNIQISCQNGVRLNNSAGNDTTEGTILNASFRKTYIVQNGTNFTGTGIQATFCSKLEITEQCEVQGFNYNVDVYYSDTVLISHNRIWQFGYTAIRTAAIGSYGSDSLIEQNELYSGNTSSQAFILAGDLSTTIRNNYIEQTVSQGTGLASGIICNNNLKITIENNGIILPIAVSPNWLNVGFTTSLQNVKITNNQLVGTGIGPAIFNAGNGLQTFYSGGNGTTVCIHNGNTFETGIPMNTITRDQLPLSTYKTVSVLTPSFFGSIVNTNYGLSSYINNNVLVIPPSAGGNLVWMRDPNNKLTQTVSVYVLAYASGNQTLQVSTGDNFVGGSLSPISLTTKPTWFQITASVTATTELEVEFVNYTAGGANTAYIQSVVVNAP